MNKPPSENAEDQARHADIIGAGIAGLTVALALQKQGFTVSIYEQAEDLKPVGAGIVLGSNAMCVLNELGVAEALQEVGNSIKSMSVRNPRGAVLNRVQTSRYEQETGQPTVAIHRAELHRILHQAVPPSGLQTGKKLQKIEEVDGSLDVQFEDGSSFRSSLLLGADGIHSTVRNEIFGEIPLRDAQQACWRGICDGDRLAAKQAMLTELAEYWGRYRRFGFMALGENQFYWYATINHGYGVPASPEQTKQFLFDSYRGWHQPILDLIGSTDQENIVRNDLYDRLPLATWHHGNIALVGDSAHSTTPNLGQGACMAIESAAVLADSLAAHEDLETAFLHYERRRIARTRMVTNQSWRLGLIATMRNPLLAFFRNSLMRVMPETLAEKQSRTIFTHNIHADKHMQTTTT